MDLYDFIDATPKGLDSVVRRPEGLMEPKDRPSLEEEQGVVVESAETLRQERDNLAAELKALQKRLASMDEELTRLRKGSSEFNALLQTLRSGKEELVAKVKDLESQLQTLEAEGIRLKGQIEEAILERDRAREEVQQVREDKDKEIGQLKEEVSLLNQKITDYEGAIKEARQVIDNKDFEIAQLSKSNVSLQDLLKTEEERVKTIAYEKETLLLDLERVRGDFTQYMQKTRLTFTAICIALVIALAGLFIYFGKRPLPEQPRPIEPAPPVKESATPQQDTVTNNAANDKGQKASEEPLKTKEGGRILETARTKGVDKPDRKVSTETKKTKQSDVDAKPLRPISLSISGIKVEVLNIEKSEAHKLPPNIELKAEQNKFHYLVSLTGGSMRHSLGQKGSIKIDFIGPKNKLASLSSAVKVQQIHHEKAGKGKAPRKVYYLVSLNKDFQARGVIVENPVKGIKKIVIL